MREGSFQFNVLAAGPGIRSHVDTAILICHANCSTDAFQSYSGKGRIDAGISLNSFRGDRSVGILRGEFPPHVFNVYRAKRGLREYVSFDIAQIDGAIRGNNLRSLKNPRPFYRPETGRRRSEALHFAEVNRS